MEPIPEVKRVLIVGEHGPELVDLPKGTRIIPNKGAV